MKIPLVDLAIQHAEIAEEVMAGFAEVMESGSFILGAPVRAFEEEFASFCGVRHCIGVGSGTDALELILRAAGIGAGHEVILPANTFIATALAVVRAGAHPVLVDCDSRFQLVDVDHIDERIGSRTRAIIAVDLFGQMADWQRLEELASARGVLLMEDAAQSQGARRGRRSAGSCGSAAGTSFYPAKNLGAYGDAGAVLSQSDEIAERVRCLRNYGSDQRYHHPERGFNSRLDTLQAVVLRAKLKRIQDWNRLRVEAAERYAALLSDEARVRPPETAPGNEHVWHLYTVRIAERERVLDALHAAGIGAAVHYPVPIHLQGAFSHLGEGPGSFPEAERAASSLLSLPLFPGITEAQQERVVEVLRSALAD